MTDKILLEEQDFLNPALAGDDANRKLLISKLDEYLHAGDKGLIRDFFMRIHPADSAQVLEFFSQAFHPY